MIHYKAKNVVIFNFKNMPDGEDEFLVPPLAHVGSNGNVGDGVLDLGMLRECHLRLDVSGIGIKDVAEAAGIALDLFAADEMPDGTHA